MKLLVFAHTPPPHHGQSYMVQLMLDGFGGDHRKRHRTTRTAPDASVRPDRLPRDIECYHINVRVSKGLEDIGTLRLGKFVLLAAYCLQAIWCRYRYGVKIFYYIPAPGKQSALYRDWLVMFLCRPFFEKVILHWHASGLARWLEMVKQMPSRALTYRLMKQVDLSIVLSSYGRADAEKLLPQRVVVEGNGIPDPCPQFRERVLPLRRARAAARRLLRAGQPVPAPLRAAAGEDPEVIHVLFLAHCTREKGLFDATHGAVLAQRKLVEARSPLTLKLRVAGLFVNAKEEAEFKQACAAHPGVIEYAGFVSGDAKQRLFERSDLFCFPSHLESFGLVLIEAMAYGLPIVTTRCGAIPEVMPAGYPGIVPGRDPQAVAEAALQILDADNFEPLRRHFEEHYALEPYLNNLAAALRSVETGNDLAGSDPKG